MLSRDLLRDAVIATAKSRSQTMTVATMQRRIRVGFATALHLVTALEAAGVLGEYRNGRRPVLAHDAEWGHRLVAEAIQDGRIDIDVPENPIGAA